MRFKTSQKHMIDFLFPVALFFVFALSALTVLLLAARIYQSTTENSSLNFTSRTSLSYISEKIHQNDCEGAVYLGEFDGCEALVMEQSHEAGHYYTYIYVYGQELKELFIKAGADAHASAGQTIMEVQDFSIASAVCVQFFIKSHILSNDSRALTHAVNECADIAEMLDTADGMTDALTLLNKEYPDGTFPELSDRSEAEVHFYYDEAFSACSDTDSSYTLSLFLSEADHTLTARMDFAKASGESVYQLETSYHIARRVSDETR